MYGLWANPLYRESAGLIIGSLFVLSFIFFLLRKKGPLMNSAWASIKSWIFVAPILFAILALPRPYPLIFITLIAIQSAKTFFQMVGVYHRSWFVWMTYVFIIGLAYMVHSDQPEFYNITPMVFLGTICLIPLLRNSAAHMIQYLALTLIGFIFWGWSFMHLARLIALDGGVLMVIYLYLLNEVGENVAWAAGKAFGHIKPFSKISQKVTLEGMIVSFVVTMLLAWALRQMLPDRSEQFWIGAGLIAAIFGRAGDLILSVIRRDLGIKNTGIFIIGRGDVLSRVEKMIFVGPMYYYLFIYLQGFHH